MEGHDQSVIFIISSRETLPLAAAVVKAEWTERPEHFGVDTSIMNALCAGLYLEQGIHLVGQTVCCFLRL